MKKLSKKLSLRRETLVQLDAPSLAQANGAAIEKSVTRCGSDCCSEVLCSAPGLCVGGTKPPIITQP